MTTKTTTWENEYYLIENNGKFYLSRINDWRDDCFSLFDHFRSKEECELFIRNTPSLWDINCNIVYVIENNTRTCHMERVKTK